MDFVIRAWKRTGSALTAALVVGSAAACTIDLRPGAENAFAADEPFEFGRQAPQAIPPDSLRPGSGRRIIQPEGVARLPVFSSAVRAGHLLFLSGQIGTLPGGGPPTLVDGGVQAETRQTLDNIVTVLAADTLQLDDLVKCTVFLADIADYAAVNEVYASYFTGDPPARSALAGSGLALGARVEIECIAVYPPGR